MISLRSFIFIDHLQAQVMSYLGTMMRGYLPRRADASLIVEIAPGLDIEWLTDVALKHANIRPGILVVERQFGYLEFHSRQLEAVKSAATAILDAVGMSAADAMAPEILASRVIDRVDDIHAFLVNRSRQGSMLLPGESLFLLEMVPASYAILAANEAEKAADIKLIDCRFIGASGRLYLSGSEAAVRAAAEAAVAGLNRFASKP